MTTDDYDTELGRRVERAIWFIGIDRTKQTLQKPDLLVRRSTMYESNQSTLVARAKLIIPNAF